jgi:2-C-methyl-D-erythritol 4-phosphate cytidylyltransferase/2-C-methyl-D-erythritol 2,4-cyclodiphosphate synthase
VAGGSAGRPLADAVIVAAGASRRMGGTDKVLAPIGGRPLLAWTIEAVAASPAIDRVVVVTAPDRVDALAGAPWLPPSVASVAPGGATRQASVAAGVRRLAELDPDGLDRPVLVHDGARPLVSTALVTAVAEATARYGAAIPVLSVTETIKRIGDGRVLETVDRSTLAAAQTPQGARRSLLEAAWAAYPPDGERQFTDEAAVLEACTIPVHAIPGEPANLKVTMPDDLLRVEHALGERALAPARARVGFGHDSHPFGPGSGLRLGGVEIAGAPRLAGHSDGDVALHAVADALLGAAGLGDLGRLFPSDARTPRGVASEDLVREVVARLAASGLRPASADVVIIGARPKLGARLDSMRDAIARLLGVPPAAVNVKASTGNLAGDEGAGRSMAARAVATLEPTA